MCQGQVDDVGVSMLGIIATLFLGPLSLFGGWQAAGSMTGATPGAATSALAPAAP
ncbi:hypothetical protein [Paeniglutamicibacter cryotolerans]|uniref:Uncharacterized protein n=1 Tax=Paeniglutamicibacter cryotolerans TaxID=670079 RepID=A0A839QDT9_9MICC|nr:hypothetical protein [Paeniglutamicibacter cryotolerans]MBB2994070.1 hypothetical protein [Paeniglutamicibacter cryotolerans]